MEDLWLNRTLRLVMDDTELDDSEFHQQNYTTSYLNSLENQRLTYVILFPFFIIFGTIGNILIFIVMRRGLLKDICTCYYMAMLSVADIGKINSVLQNAIIVNNGGSRISPRWGRQTLQWGGGGAGGGAAAYNIAKFSQKLSEIERIWTPRKERPSKISLCRSATS